MAQASKWHWKPIDFRPPRIMPQSRRLERKVIPRHLNKKHWPGEFMEFSDESSDRREGRWRVSVQEAQDSYDESRADSAEDQRQLRPKERRYRKWEKKQMSYEDACARDNTDLHPLVLRPRADLRAEPGTPVVLRPRAEPTTPMPSSPLSLSSLSMGDLSYHRPRSLGSASGCAAWSNATSRENRSSRSGRHSSSSSHHAGSLSSTKRNRTASRHTSSSSRRHMQLRRRLDVLQLKLRRRQLIRRRP